MKTVVLVVPDHEHRIRLAMLLQNHLGFAKVVEAERFADACQQAGADLIVIDLSAPDAGDDLLWGGLKFCHPIAQFAMIFDGQVSQSNWTWYNDVERNRLLLPKSGWLATEWPGGPKWQPSNYQATTWIN